MRSLCAALLLAVAGPAAVALAASGGAQAPQPGSAAKPPPGGALTAPASGGASAPSGAPVSTPVAAPPPASSGGGAAAPLPRPEGGADVPAHPAPAADRSPPPATRPPPAARPPARDRGSGSPEHVALPAVALALAPPPELAQRAHEVAVSAGPLVEVVELAQRDGGRDRRNRGDLDIEVPVPREAPGTAPQQPAQADPVASLPRTGLEVVLAWGAGVALLSGGLGLQAVTRRRREKIF